MIRVIEIVSLTPTTWGAAPMQPQGPQLTPNHSLKLSRADYRFHTSSFLQLRQLVMRCLQSIIGPSRLCHLVIKAPHILSKLLIFISNLILLYFGQHESRSNCPRAYHIRQSSLIPKGSGYLPPRTVMYHQRTPLQFMSLRMFLTRWCSLVMITVVFL
ncbi:hypothetical protein BDV26DRAFT_259926 [Aspergillus bertholletiae]|uniref:Uncharacterized protein n=1 Tax=Aspergillus bertholletiae TaxID=1226010 RepID=A0A5N7BBP0_9EURO|nr:hypothetical protein BDV26DRAFT_259926 [Aspergillus bertholletiae]